MDWYTGHHYEHLDANTDRLAMCFPAGDGEHWWWAVFDETQSSIIASGSDDELKDAQANALAALRR